MQKIELLTEKISVGGREFLVKEHTASEVQRYLSDVMDVMKATEEGMAQKLTDHHLGLGSMSDYFSEMVVKKDSILRQILGEPIDDKGPLPKEFFYNLSHRQVRELIKIQENLNDIEDILGKSEAVLTTATALQATEKILTKMFNVQPMMETGLTSAA